MTIRRPLPSLSWACACAGSFCLFSVQLFAQAGSPVQALGTLTDSTTSSPNAQGTAAPASSMIVSEDFSKLRIAPGFELSLQTFEVPDLSGLFRVEESGDILIPLADSIHVSGLTPAEASQVIKARFLARNILKHPQVKVSIEQYSEYLVTVLGQVKSPGRIALIAPHSLLDVLALAGGETVIAGGRIQVRHTSGKIDEYLYKKDSDSQSIQDVMIVSGDTVIIPRAGIVYVLGSVYRPGGYLMQEDGNFNVAEALSLALGLTLQAKVSNIDIVRRKPDGSYETIPVDYKKITSGKEAPANLFAEDIIYVPVSKVKTALTTGAGLISAAATSTVYAVRP